MRTGSIPMVLGAFYGRPRECELFQMGAERFSRVHQACSLHVVGRKKTTKDYLVENEKRSFPPSELSVQIKLSLP